MSAEKPIADRISIMLHDLRSPVNTVGGFARLLRDEQAGPLTDRQKEFLDCILEGAREMEAIIDEGAHALSHRPPDERGQAGGFAP